MKRGSRCCFDGRSSEVHTLGVRPVGVLADRERCFMRRKRVLGNCQGNLADLAEDSMSPSPLPAGAQVRWSPTESHRSRQAFPPEGKGVVAREPDEGREGCVVCRGLRSCIDSEFRSRRRISISEQKQARAESGDTS
jgi:hypothetical protein